jgi:NDP-sugar pyrophosphorylase family protein
LRLQGEEQGRFDLAVLILAGGLGSRLRSITKDKVAKPMVEVIGRPFLLWLIEDLVHHGFRQIWLSVGHNGSSITSFPWNEQFPSCEIGYIVETERLGTGGAIAHFFEKQSPLSECIVVNGDTHTIANGFTLPEVFDSAKGEVHFLTLNQSQMTIDQKANLCADGGRIVNCTEACPPSQFDIGVVKVSRKAVNRYNGSIPCSIHDLILPSILSGTVRYSEINAKCFDIGTPERLSRYEDYLREITQKDVIREL